MDIEPRAEALYRALNLADLLSAADVVAPRKSFVQSMRAYLDRDSEVEPAWDHLVLRFVVSGDDGEANKFQSDLAKALWDYAERLKRKRGPSGTAADILDMASIEVVTEAEERAWPSNRSSS